MLKHRRLAYYGGGRRPIPQSLHLLESKRHVWPLVAAGVGVFLAGNLIRYSIRAYERMQQEEGTPASPSDDGSTSSSSSAAASGNRPSSSVPLTQCLGLDMGSSFSKVAHLNTLGSPPVSVLENRQGLRSVASALYAHSSEEGIQAGQIARAARFVKPGKTATAILHMLLDDPSSNAGEEATVTLDGKQYSGSALLTLLAGDLLSTAAAKGLKGIPAVVTAPNAFSDAARARLIMAVRAAGVECVDAVPDGVAAVLGAASLLGSRGSDLMPPPGQALTVAVVDIGGLATQLSLVHVSAASSDGQRPPPPTLVNSITLPHGGESFDAALAAWCAAEFTSANKLPPNHQSLLQDVMAKQRLYDACEQCRCQLSSAASASIHVPFISATPSGPLHLTLTMSRAQLDVLLAPQVGLIKESFKTLLFEGGATAPLRAVLLVGGGSRMAFARGLVRDITGGMEGLTFTEPEEVGSVGAARWSAYL